LTHNFGTGAKFLGEDVDPHGGFDGNVNSQEEAITGTASKTKLIRRESETPFALHISK